MASESAALPFLGEIVVEKVIRVGYSGNPPMLEVEIVQVERGDSRSRLVIQFSEQARFSILSAVEDILKRSDKVDGNPSTPITVQ